MGTATDEIKSRLNIVDLIGEYVRLQKAGANWKARCPFHNEKTPSFSVSEDKQFWHCFGCGKGGDAFDFLMEIEGVDFKEALKDLAQRTGVEIPRYSGKKGMSQEAKNRIWEILEISTKFYEKQLWEGEGRKNALPYLKDRGIGDGSIKEFRLGYAPEGWKNLLEFLTGRGYELEDILKTGLLVEKNSEQKNQNSGYYDRFRDRIIFPIADISGRIVGFSARVAPGGDESQAKYVNTPETEAYHKSSALYGIDKAKMEIRSKDWVLLVEGNMDVIASWQAGIKNVVAVSGTALTSEQLNIIKRYTGNIKMFFDMDEAGQKAAKRSAELAFGKEMDVSIVEIKTGKDAADAARKDAPGFLKSVENSFPVMDYFINKLVSEYGKDSISGKKKIIKELEGLVSSFSNKVEKEHWIRKISEKLDVSEKVLFDSFGKSEYPRRKSDAGPEERIGAPIVQDRKNNIQIQIMGFLISDSEVWKKSLEKYEEEIDKFFSNQKIKDIIVTKGADAGFSFNKLFEKIEDLSQKSFLRKIYFENTEKGEEFPSFEEKMKLIDSYFSELKKEISKSQIKEIVECIRKAEETGDKEEAKRLTKELAELPRLRE